MSILVDDSTRIVVQGATGHQGQFHSNRMKQYGTKIVGGVTPGKGGQTMGDIPIFDSVDEVEADASIIFVPARFVKSSALEAISLGLSPVVCITEHVPVRDAMFMMEYAKQHDVDIVGPNTPGLISPGKALAGILPPHIFKEGNVGLVSRSGTLTYEIIDELTKNGYGQSTAIGVGGDPVIGMDFLSTLERFEADKETKAIVMIGEIGGNAEELAAEYIKEYISKPVVSYIAGKTAPPGKRMGHAGAVISGNSGTAESKIKALNAVGVQVATMPQEVPDILRNLL
ncbi:MAG TPA: succinate--CoA ligase subunit alpha [Candidatus Methanofastidiosa archaeon]|nr:succinate--CoA ligase subunit alpha [Candidatus Methanofastidiosa archaeon]